MNALKRFFILWLLVLSACNHPSYVHDFAFENGWEKSNVLKFSQEIIVRDRPYEIIANCVLDSNFEEEEIRFLLSYEDSVGETWEKGFVIPIKDRDGNFIEKKTNGKYNYNFSLLKNKYFGSKGLCNFEVQNLNSRMKIESIRDFQIIFKL